MSFQESPLLPEVPRIAVKVLSSFSTKANISKSQSNEPQADKDKHQDKLESFENSDSERANLFQVITSSDNIDPPSRPSTPEAPPSSLEPHCNQCGGPCTGDCPER